MSEENTRVVVEFVADEAGNVTTVERTEPLSAEEIAARDAQRTAMTDSIVAADTARAQLRAAWQAANDTTLTQAQRFNALLAVVRRLYKLVDQNGDAGGGP